jgi:hypothetical protein
MLFKFVKIKSAEHDGHVGEIEKKYKILGPENLQVNRNIVDYN